MKSSARIKSVCGIVLIVLASMFVIYGALMCWVMRDGMGPDSIESHGTAAFMRFLKEFWIALVINLPAGLFGFWIARKRKEPIQSSTAQRP